MNGQLWLTKNDKKVLKLLVNNGKLSDTEISKEINITSQAVGRIRKQLEEEEIIEKYSVKLNLKRLGLNLIVIMKVNIEGCDDEVIKKTEEMIKDSHEVFILLKTISSKRELRFLAGFRNLEELEEFMINRNKESNCYLSEITVLSSNGIIKDSINDLSNKLINSCGSKEIEKDEIII